jgi:hypothetical protein
MHDRDTKGCKSDPSDGTIVGCQAIRLGVCSQGVGVVETGPSRDVLRDGVGVNDTSNTIEWQDVVAILAYIAILPFGNWGMRVERWRQDFAECR